MDPSGGLLADIAENPDDDTPRLVFADWHEENGDPARAEFIRVQLALASADEWAEGREELLWRQVVSLFDDVEPCLIELRRGGLRPALVSDCAYQTRAVVDGWQLGRHFDAVALSWEVGLAKPDPAIYLHALKLLGGQPEATLLVDDKVEFLDAASRLGIQTRLMCRGSQAASTAHPPLAGLRELVQR